MGRLLSVPKIPTARISSAVTTSSLTPTSTVADSSSAAVSDSNVDNIVETEEERNLLTRSGRGISETIRTSYRGLLGANDTTPVRKSLLGE